MAHPLGELVLVVPEDGRAPDAAQLAELESALTAREISHRRVGLPAAGELAEMLAGEAAAGTRLVVACGHQSVFATVARAVVDGTIDLVVGVFSGGRSHDFAKSFGLDVPPRTAA